MAKRSSEGPLIRGFQITPNDSANLVNTVSGFHANESGNVNFVWIDTGSNTVIYVTQGSFYPYRSNKILQTGTTANNLIGLL